MKEEIFVYFIGTAGSGKSTLTGSLKRWTELKGLDAITVNLDPGAENLPYEPDVDIRDWISLEEIMDSHELGPNGAQIACADMVALNTPDIKESIDMPVIDYLPKHMRVLEESVNEPVISTGFKKFDSIISGGYLPGLYTLGAISSIGKTALTLRFSKDFFKSCCRAPETDK